MELAPDLPAIMGADNEIRDALTNLVFNAVDAMPAGGTLTLRTRAEARDGTMPTRVIVEVSDTGIGMDEETRRRCLEPFFTTKGERGTGLGLAMVYGMIQRHSADLEIDSAPGRGTTMRLVFAAASPAIAQRARCDLRCTPSRPSAPAAGGRRSDAAQLVRGHPARGRPHRRRPPAAGRRASSLPVCLRAERALRPGDHRPRHAPRRWPQGGGRRQVAVVHARR